MWLRGCAARLFEIACLVQESTIEMRLGPLEAPATKQHTPGTKMQSGFIVKGTRLKFLKFKNMILVLQGIARLQGSWNSLAT